MNLSRVLAQTRGAWDAWNESAHPRAENGQFGEGGHENKLDQPVKNKETSPAEVSEGAGMIGKTVSVKQWEPAGGGQIRWYVSDADGAALGYIKTSIVRGTGEFNTGGYGSGYYAQHRAAKGDPGEYIPAEYEPPELVGDAVLLQAVIDRAIETTGIRGPEALKEISQNNVARAGAFKKGKNKRDAEAAQRSRTLDI